MRAKPAVVNGVPRSDVNTKGDFGSCSRCSRRRARNSSPRIGCVLGVPCLTLRTCRAAVRKSICSQRRSTSSDTRRPCRKTRTMVASRWPWRLRLTAMMSLSTSASVRCSRVRRSVFGGLLGGTVRKTVVGATSRRRFFAMKFKPHGSMTVRTTPLVDDARGATAHARANAFHYSDRLQNSVHCNRWPDSTRLVCPSSFTENLWVISQSSFVGKSWVVVTGVTREVVSGSILSPSSLRIARHSSTVVFF